MAQRIEDFMRSAVAIIRDVPSFRHATIATADAVVDSDADGDGRLDDNPDTSGGVEAGRLEIRVPLFELDDESPVVRFTDEQLKPEAWYVLDERRVVELGEKIGPFSPLDLARLIVEEVKERRKK